MTTTQTTPDPVTAERERVTAISAKCSEHADALKASGKADIQAKAISDGWTIDQMNDELLGAIRASRARHTGVGGVNDTPTGPKVLAAAALLCAGQSDIAEKSKRFSENELTAAAELKASSGYEILRAAVRQERGSVSGDKNDVIKAAFSTSQLGEAMSAATEAVLIAGYEQAEVNWRAIARPVSLTGFREGKAIKPYTTDSLLEEVGADGEIRHTALGEDNFPIQLATYARIVTVTRQTMIDDGGLGSLFEIQRAIGQNAARTLNRLVWLALRGADYYSSDNANLLTGSGSALDVDGLSAAIAKLREQTDEASEPLGLQPATLAVPPALESAARVLLSTHEVHSGGGESNSNPWQGVADLAVSPYLAASAGGDDDKWYLTTNPGMTPPLVVGLLNGVDRPSVERLETAPNILGMTLRAFMDFGVGQADPRGVVRSNGK